MMINARASARSASILACLALVALPIGSLLPFALSAELDLLSNGDFEVPPGIYPYAVFGTANPPPGWTVESGTVEIVGTYWQAAKGTQSLDLNGIFEEIGTIYQDVATEPSRQYRIRFAYAGNPECGPTVKTTEVSWAGMLLDTLTFDTTGHSFQDMGWGYHEYQVTAEGDVGRIRFKSTVSSFCGPALDDVSVTPVAVTTSTTTTTSTTAPPTPEICTSLNATRATLNSQLEATEQQVRQFLTGAPLRAALARIDAARAQANAAIDRALTPFGCTPSPIGASAAWPAARRQ